MSVTLVLAFALAVFVLSITPGPDMMFVVGNGLTGGRRAGMVAALGMSTGLVVHTLAVAFGLGAVIASAPAVLDGVRIAGAVFLLYLAVTTWRASGRQASEAQAEVAQPRRSLRKVYVLAMLTNLANPKVVLFYLAFLPQFLTEGPTAWPVTAQLLTLGAGFIAIGLAVDGSAGVLAGTLKDRLLRRVSLRRWLDRIVASVFGGLAAHLVLGTR
ncbi:threonine/homoserine/homoserine lactone efflux protein [Lipingzhangella halophila]|uniref:Threonine/homoserine/homoserine lactone efflux protein n=1 Tax=Lipingzhangella halophila TaxID=1783352 RepID=A0A7W7RFT8_9ACTN|nr:LysE family translocator [Lipingzhangella halophila]MBB4931085.1 threonine/homoserine/homoserine lactone efflux protein [Lipingzhangella halophila]